MVNWLGNIGKKADHPMYNVGAARKLLGDLPLDQARAFEEISSWLETVTAADGYAPSDRIGVVKLLDEIGQEHEAIILESFLRQAEMKEFDRLKLWQALVGFWEHLSAAYRRCLQDIAQGAGSAAAHPEYVLLVTRALRALANEAKFLHLRYLPMRPRVWQEMAELYATAEKAQAAEQSLKAYATDNVLTSPRREFLRALMLEAAVPESEKSAAVELTARIIARFCSGFSIEVKPGSDCNFCFDLARPGRPVHYSPKIPASDTLRYFGAGLARASIQEIVDGYKTGPEAVDRRFGEEYTLGEKLVVMKRLLLYWGDSPPRRRGPRAKIGERVEISRGFDSVAELVTRIEFSGMAEMTEDMRLKVKQQTGIALQLMEASAVVSVWSERDSSAWGIGVGIPRQDEWWARIGTLCALRAPGQQLWWVGEIRRMYRDQREQPFAGIEILAKKPLSVYLRGVGEGAERAENWQTSSGSFRFTYKNAIILGESATSAAHHEILLKRDEYTTGTIYEAMMAERSPHLRLEELIERGENFDRVRVAWL